MRQSGFFSPLGSKDLPVLAGSKPGARSAPTAAQKAALAQGQQKGEKGKARDGEDGEAEKPPDTRTWLQVIFWQIHHSMLGQLLRVVLVWYKAALS